MKKIAMNNITHSTKQFTYSPETRTFTAEISDFSRSNPIFCMTPGWKSGFVLESHVTGKRIPMVVYKKDVSPDGDIMGWWLCPQLGVGAVGIKALIIND